MVKVRVYNDKNEKTEKEILLKLERDGHGVLVVAVDELSLIHI